jgi:hypothetical protein
MTHVYIVRCNFTAPEREPAWNAWYSGPKIRQMLAQPHFLSCQRFRRVAGTGRDYLALWVVQSPEALTTSQYVSQWGFAEWERDVTAWSRDLFDAGARSPRDFAVAPDGALQLTSFDGMDADDMKAANAAIVQSGPDMMWLPVAGLDRHTPLIGLRALPAPPAGAPADGVNHMQQAVYRPICDFQRADPG